MSIRSMSKMGQLTFNTIINLRMNTREKSEALELEGAPERA